METQLDTLGRRRRLHTGEACPICQRDDFRTNAQYVSHQNWHVRKQEAVWEPVTGRNRKLVPYHASNYKSTIIEINEAEASDEFAKATQVIEDLQRAMVTLNLLVALQQLPTAQFQQFSSTIISLAKRN